MSDAQIGLMTATPIIIAFAIALRRMGVLSTVATVSAVSLSVAIATVLFTTRSPGTTDEETISYRRSGAILGRMS